jgi:hypothetical protein
LKGEDLSAQNVGARSQDPTQPLIAGLGTPRPGDVSPPRRVRVVLRWRRFDTTMKDRPADEAVALDPKQRYMTCGMCGYKDMTQDGATLPDTVADPTQGPMCPDCAKREQVSLMGRVDREFPPVTTLVYPRGCRLTIVAPDQRRVFYDDAWPYGINGKPMRNVPYAFFKCYDLPLEPWADCDTDWDFSYQVTANALDRRAYEFLSQIGGILIGPMSGLNDWSGKQPFQFTDRPISLARATNPGQPQVSYFQPHGMVAEIMPFAQFLNGQFRADSGIADLGLSPQQSKDIPVGTVRTLFASGEVPVDDLAEQVRDEMSSFFGVWYDMKRAVMTERQLTMLRGEDGRETFAMLRGEELPNADVIVGSGPNWDEFDAERAEKFRTMMSIPPGMDPLTWSKVIPILAEVANIPPDLVRKFQKALAPPQPFPGAMPGDMPNPEANGGAMPPQEMPPALAARMSGPGMVPGPMMGASR